jgi:hypothetical protein
VICPGCGETELLDYDSVLRRLNCAWGWRCAAGRGAGPNYESFRWLM